jgi:hypothetical protein
MRIVMILFVVLIVGCGYHTPGASDTWVGGDARYLYIQLFDNQTAEPYLDNYMTDSLVAELSKSRLVKLTEDSTRADVLLVGAVDEFKSNARSYGSTDQITDYRSTMKVTVRLQRKGSSEVLWKETLQRSEDYLATVNKTLQLEGQSFAARRVSQRLAEDIYAALLNSF